MENLPTPLLSSKVRPLNYNLSLTPNFDSATFDGNVKIKIELVEDQTHVTLHSHCLKIHKVSVFNDALQEVSVSKFSEITSLQQLLIYFENKLSPGIYDIDIDYSGYINEDFIGLYSVWHEDARMMVASKLRPTYARQAFPCFDEPHFKASFDITLVKPKKLIALSNMNVNSKEPSGTDKEIVKFSTSLPMSAHMACFVICDYVYQEVEINTHDIGNNFKLRTYAQKEDLYKVEFSLEIGKKATEFYIKYFSIPYPLPKLDMIAIPDYVSGATEHWGLITFRESSILIDAEEASSLNKINVAHMIIHELAHMWFGNLVTVKWWDNLWMTEGFSTYMQFKVFGDMYPLECMMDQFLTKIMHPVLAIDAKQTTHALMQEVTTPDEIGAIFDSISYYKGASVLRMLEHFIGPENFRRGVSDYLREHQFGNSDLSDFLKSLNVHFKDSRATLNISYIISTWTTQTGYPVLLVENGPDANSYVIKQKRFLADPEMASLTSKPPPKERWFIPITYKTGGDESDDIVWFPDKAEYVVVQLSSSDEWIKFNNNQVGVYRVAYPNNMWEKLIEQLKNKAPELTTCDRAHLLDDVFALAEARQVPYEIALSLSTYLAVEEEFVPWETAAAIFNNLLKRLKSTKFYDKFKLYIQKLVQPMYESIKWKAPKKDMTSGLMRRKIFSLALQVDLPEIVKMARKMFLQWLNIDGTVEDIKLDPDLRDVIYIYGMKNATQYEFQKLWDIYKAESDAHELVKLRQALAAPQDRNILKSYLKLARDELNVRKQDYLTVLQYIAANEQGNSIVWAHVLRHWPDLVSRFTLNSRQLANLIPAITADFDTQEQLSEMLAFFTKYPDAGAGESARRNALETVRQNIRWAANHHETFANWLSAAKRETHETYTETPVTTETPFFWTTLSPSTSTIASIRTENSIVTTAKLPLTSAIASNITERLPASTTALPLMSAVRSITAESLSASTTEPASISAVVSITTEHLPASKTERLPASTTAPPSTYAIASITIDPSFITTPILPSIHAIVPMYTKGSFATSKILTPISEISSVTDSRVLFPKLLTSSTATTSTPSLSAPWVQPWQPWPSSSIMPLLPNRSPVIDLYPTSLPLMSANQTTTIYPTIASPPVFKVNSKFQSFWGAKYFISTSTPTTPRSETLRLFLPEQNHFLSNLSVDSVRYGTPFGYKMNFQRRAVRRQPAFGLGAPYPLEHLNTSQIVAFDPNTHLINETNTLSKEFLLPKSMFTTALIPLGPSASSYHPTIKYTTSIDYDPFQEMNFLRSSSSLNPLDYTVTTREHADTTLSGSPTSGKNSEIIREFFIETANKIVDEYALSPLSPPYLDNVGKKIQNISTHSNTIKDFPPTHVTVTKYPITSSTQDSFSLIFRSSTSDSTNANEIPVSNFSALLPFTFQTPPTSPLSSHAYFSKAYILSVSHPQTTATSPRLLRTIPTKRTTSFRHTVSHGIELNSASSSDSSESSSVETNSSSVESQQNLAKTKTAITSKVALLDGKKTAHRSVSQTAIPNKSDEPSAHLRSNSEHSSESNYSDSASSESVSILSRHARRIGVTISQKNTSFAIHSTFNSQPITSPATYPLNSRRDVNSLNETNSRTSTSAFSTASFRDVNYIAKSFTSQPPDDLTSIKHPEIAFRSNAMSIPFIVITPLTQGSQNFSESEIYQAAPIRKARFINVSYPVTFIPSNESLNNLSKIPHYFHSKNEPTENSSRNTTNFVSHSYATKSWPFIPVSNQSTFDFTFNGTAALLNSSETARIISKKNKSSRDNLSLSIYDKISSSISSSTPIKSDYFTSFNPDHHDALPEFTSTRISFNSNSYSDSFHQVAVTFATNPLANVSDNSTASAAVFNKTNDLTEAIKFNTSTGTTHPADVSSSGVPGVHRVTYPNEMSSYASTYGIIVSTSSSAPSTSCPVTTISTTSPAPSTWSGPAEATSARSSETPKSDYPAKITSKSFLDFTKASSPASSQPSATYSLSHSSKRTEPQLSRRLSPKVRPLNYNIILNPNLETDNFTGNIEITVDINQEIDYIYLHSHFLNINEVKVFHDKEEVPVSSFAEVKQLEILLIRFENLLKIGIYRIIIDFTGNLSRNLVGFYISQLKDNRKMVATKFEPTYARQAFPCFDEPDFKATFDITVVKPKSLVALSNMEVKTTMPAGSDLEIVTFNTSVPMSTYLACFVICDFDYKEVQVNSHGIGENFTLRAYGQRDQMHKIDYALYIGLRATEYYIKYYKVPYPLPKLDMIAIPDYISGATEHWGLITYRETSFLIDEEEASSLNKIAVANTIAHELAHMWFGNLVTMKWWDDLWLNEGFASYMQVKVLEDIEPSWSMPDQFLIKTLQPVMVTDAKMSSHPIVQVVTTPDEITAIFDEISYSKGASICRMVENFVGSENFRSGISEYLKKHAFNNTITQDLLTCLEKKFESDHPGLSLTHIMDTWTRQMGYPLLTLEESSTNGTYTITQKRFVLDPAGTNANDSKFDYRWFIPITFKTNLGGNRDIMWFPDTAEKLTITLHAEEVWIKLNANQVGYYRVNYPTSLWKKLNNELLKKSHHLSSSDRSNLLNDVFALADAYVVPYELALNLSEYLVLEEDYVPWETASTCFTNLKNRLDSHTDILPLLLEYVQSLLLPLYNTMHWHDTEMDVIEGLRRTTILSLATHFELPQAEAEVRKIFKGWLSAVKTSQKFVVDPDLRDIIYTYGMKNATMAEWDELWQIYLAETDSHELMKLRKALAAPRNSEIIKKYLTLAHNETNVRRQDYLNVLQYIAKNPMGAPLVWAHVHRLWPELVERFSLNNRYLGNLIPGITAYFDTQAQFDEMMEFFTKYPDAGAGKAARQRAIETMRYNMGWRENHRPVVKKWLENKKIAISSSLRL